MTTGGFRFEPYEAGAGREWMLVRGSSIGLQVLILPPLFEEMNFVRQLLAELGRLLAERGIGSWLPDLPGTGESRGALAALGWDDWRDAARTAGEAIAARTGRRPLTCAFRGGALLDDAVDAAARWRYASVTGEALLRHLRRAQHIADREAGVEPGEADGIAELAGYPLSAAMRAGLDAAAPATVSAREVAAIADGAPWRRAEPAGDPALARRLADDIANWASACASR